MTTKTLIRNLKRLEKVMVGMLDLPVEQDARVAMRMAESGKTAVCFNLVMYKPKNTNGRCGCVFGFCREKDDDYWPDDELGGLGIFAPYKGKGDTVRSRLTIVRKLIKKYERD